MRWCAAENYELTIDTAEAIAEGAPSTGGLFVPDHFPKPANINFNHDIGLAEFATLFLSPFFKNTLLEDHLSAICHESFNFPIPLKTLDDKVTLLELFHGPTLSFKDFGARFFSRCLSRLSQDKTRLVLVATSGDTGSAVASSFYKVPNTKAAILFPKDGVSKRQKQQICAFDDNIFPLEVSGSFDDCQALVKAALNDSKLKNELNLTTANSINIARVLAQTAYLAFSAYMHYQTIKKPVNLIIPSGNLGHVTAAFYAKVMHAPIANITLATNANQAVLHYWQTGEVKFFPTIKTLANAMDVGAPSNLKRLIHLWHQFPALQKEAFVQSANDKDIKKAIKSANDVYHEMICPHTACALNAFFQNPQSNSLIAATAHAAKFNDVIEPLLSLPIAIPESLDFLLAKKITKNNLSNYYEDFKSVLQCIGSA